MLGESKKVREEGRVSLHVLSLFLSYDMLPEGEGILERVQKQPRKQRREYAGVL